MVKVAAITASDTGFEGTDITFADSLGDGIAWEPIIASTGSPAWSYGERWFLKRIGTGVSMTGSADAGAFDVDMYRIEFYEYATFNPVTPVRFARTQNPTVADGEFTFDLAGKPRRDSEILASITMVLNSGTNAVTPGTEFTELFDTSNAAAFFSTQTQARTGPTDHIISWADIESGDAAGAVAVAFEVLDVASLIPEGAVATIVSDVEEDEFLAELRGQWFDPLLFIEKWFDEDLEPAAGAGNDMSATGSLSISGAADLDATGSLAAAGAVSITGLADMDASGSLAAVGAVSISGLADLDATGSLLAAGTLSISGAADLDAVGQLLAAGSIFITGSAELTGTAANDMSAAGSLSITGLAGLTAFGALIAQGSIVITGSADVTDAVLAPPVDEFFSGGFFVAFEREQERRRRKLRKREEETEEAEVIQDAVTREIALILKAEEAKDIEREEIERLRLLVRQFADRQAEEAFSERTRTAFLRAAAQENASAILALAREMERQLEEEEFAVLMALALDD